MTCLAERSPNKHLKLTDGREGPPAASSQDVPWATRAHMRPMLAIASAMILATCHRSSTPQVRVAELARAVAAMQEADQIVVSQNRSKDAKVLYASVSQKDIDEFLTAAAFDKGVPGPACVCTGSPSVRLYRHGAGLLEISSHHGETIQIGEMWLSYASLKDLNRWSQWFATRRIPIRVAGAW
jgi:hypothetical protein